MKRQKKKSLSFELGNSVLNGLGFGDFVAEQIFSKFRRFIFYKWTIFPRGIGNNF
jgi:hypothetical protein